MNVAVVLLGLLLVPPVGPGREGTTVDALMRQVKEGTKLPERLASLDRAIRLSSADQRIASLHVIKELGELYRPESRDGLPRAEVERRAQGIHVLRHFIYNACRPYTEDERTRTALLRMLFDTAVTDNPAVHGDIRVKAFQRVMEFAQTEMARTRFALEVVERQDQAVGWLATNHLTHPDRFDARTLERFRQILRTSLQTDRPNRFVLSVLGDRGDEEILEELLEFSARTDVEPGFMYGVTNAIRRIQIQHPPTRLLDFLKSGRGDARAAWVVKRALELGLPREDVRTAVRSYYQKCSPEMLRFARLSGLDETVIELGLLEASDLPPRDWDADWRDRLTP